MRFDLSLAIPALLFPLTAFAFSSGGPDSETGAPGEGTCAAGGACHPGPVNAGDGTMTISLPASYTPGETLFVEVHLSDPGESHWGFELTALDDSDMPAGHLMAGGADTQYSLGTNGRDYVKQTSTGACFFLGCPDAHSWTFPWVAPDAATGNVTMYACGVAGFASVYTTSQVIVEAVSTSVPEGGAAPTTWSGVKGLFR